MTVLVTGANGFVGHYIVEALLKVGHKVKAWDITFVDDYCRGVEKISGDILDKKTRASALAGCDVVVHACYFNDTVATKQHFEVNTVGSWELLKCAVESGVKYFIFLSTYLLYSPERTHTGPFVENDAVFGKDFYTANKLAVESYCRAFEACSDLKCIILRLAAVYGIRRNWDVLSRLPYSRQMMLAVENKSIEVYGQSPLIWAGDVAKSIVAILGEPEKASNVYNVVDINLKWNDCAEKIVEITSSSSDIVSVRPPHQPIVVNGSKLRDDFNLEFVGLKGFEDFLRRLRDKILCQQF